MGLHVTLYIYLPQMSWITLERDHGVR
jgi:hypothetical protein